MRFDLNPYELTRSGIDCAGEVAFELELGGETCQFRRAHDSFDLFPYFRFASNPEEHFLLARLNFWSRGRDAQPVELRPAQYPIARFAEDNSGLKTQCQRAFELNAWGRYFCLNADLSCVQSAAEVSAAKWSIFLLANGLGVLDNLAYNRKSATGFKGWNSMAPFRWYAEPAPTVLRGGTTAQWLEWLEEALRIPESTIAFAHELADKSEDEAAFRCAYWVKGSREEWENVTRWILHTETSLWGNRSQGQTVKWSYQLTEAGEAPRQEGGSLNRSGERGGNFTHERAIKRLQIISQYFSPFLDPFLINRHLSVEYHRHHMKFLRVTVSAPSAHEQLEAALSLRDWARGRFSPGELAVLCQL